MASAILQWAAPLLCAGAVAAAVLSAKGKGKLFVWLGLACVVALSLSSHSLVLSEWHMPTFGNTMIHVANAREVLEQGGYPLWADFSYGGLPQGLRNTYVPAYRMTLAAVGFLFGAPVAQLFPAYALIGFDQTDAALDLISRFLVLLFAVLLPLGFFLLARRLFGEPAGVFAALFSTLCAELLIYTVRPLPQAFGLVLLPFAFVELVRGNKISSVVLALLVAMVHQEAVAFYAAVAFAYAVFLIAFENKSYWPVASLNVSRQAKIALACWLVASVAYLGWQFYTLGSPNIFELAQFKYHEGGPATVEIFLAKVGWANALLGFAAIGVAGAWLLAGKIGRRIAQQALAAAFFVGGLLCAHGIVKQAGFLPQLAFLFPDAVGSSSTMVVSISVGGILFGIACAVVIFFVSRMLWDVVEKHKEQSGALLFAVSALCAGFALVKNDVVGINVFMDRFIVFLALPLVLLAAWFSQVLVERLLRKNSSVSP